MAKTSPIMFQRGFPGKIRESQVYEKLGGNSVKVAHNSDTFLLTIASLHLAMLSNCEILLAIASFIVQIARYKPQF